VLLEHWSLGKGTTLHVPGPPPSSQSKQTSSWYLETNKKREERKRADKNRERRKKLGDWSLGKGTTCVYRASTVFSST